MLARDNKKREAEWRRDIVLKGPSRNALCPSSQQPLRTYSQQPTTPLFTVRRGSPWIGGACQESLYLLGLLIAVQVEVEAGRGLRKAMARARPSNRTFSGLKSHSKIKNVKALGLSLLDPVEFRVFDDVLLCNLVPNSTLLHQPFLFKEDDDPITSLFIYSTLRFRHCRDASYLASLVRSPTAITNRLHYQFLFVPSTNSNARPRINSKHLSDICLPINFSNLPRGWRSDFTCLPTISDLLRCCCFQFRLLPRPWRHQRRVARVSPCDRIFVPLRVRPLPWCLAYRLFR